jgi:hypothetical protein
MEDQIVLKSIRDRPMSQFEVSHTPASSRSPALFSGTRDLPRNGLCIGRSLAPPEKRLLSG